MKRLISTILSITIILIISLTAFAAPINIGDLQDLVDNTMPDTNYLILDSGIFLIKESSKIDLTLETYKNLAITNSRSNLTVDAINIPEGIYYDSNYMLKVEDLYISAGYLTAYGGNETYIDGIRVEGNLTQEGTSTITSYGGNDYMTYGIYVEGNLIQNDTSSIVANGEKGSWAVGIGVRGNLIQNNTSSIVAYGGKDNMASGVEVRGDLTQNDASTIIAHGGEDDFVYGVYVLGTLNQNDTSSIVAYGGKDDYTWGISVQGNLNQNDESSIISYGGEGDDSWGTVINFYFVQSHESSAMFYGGKAERAYGIYAFDLNINGKLTIARMGEAASVYAGDMLTMGATSTLVPIVDLTKDASLASGFIDSFKATIITGAEIKPLFENTYVIEKGVALSDMLFLESYYPIEGSYPTEIETITFKSEARKLTTEKTYVLDITRLKTPKEAFEDASADQIYIDFVDELYNLVTKLEGNTLQSLVKLLDAIDNSVDVLDAIEAIDTPPEHVAQLVCWNDSITRILDGNQVSLINKIGALTDDGHNLFINGSYTFGKDESILGVDFGFVLQRKEVSLLVQGQMAKGKVKGDTEGSMYGITSILNYRFNLMDMLNPEIGMSLSYIDNEISIGATQRAFRVGIDIANMFKVGNLSFKPTVGINYTPIKYILDDEDAKLVSLNARLGMEIGYQTTRFKIEATGYASMNLLGHGQSLEERLNRGEGMFVVVNYFSEKDKRVSWGVGVDMQFMLTPDILGIETSYSIYGNGDYISHTLKAGVNMAF